MAWIRIKINTCEWLTFDSRNLIRVQEPVDADNGRKPCGWVDWFGAILTIGTSDGAVEVQIPDYAWPAVRKALGLDTAEVFDIDQTKLLHDWCGLPGSCEAVELSPAEG